MQTSRSSRFLILCLAAAVLLASCTMSATNGTLPPSPTPHPILQTINALAEETVVESPTTTPVESTPTVLIPIATDTLSLTPPPPTPEFTNAPYRYITQSGDTLQTVAVRFAVQAAEITCTGACPDPNALLNPNTLLIIPKTLANTTSGQGLLPDSEVIFSPSASDFDVQAFVEAGGGFLSEYDEWLGSTGYTSGAAIIQRVALENSINPRLLLSLLEYMSEWVYGQPRSLSETDYPLGKIDSRSKGLYKQLIWAVNQLSVGYYGWREGKITHLYFQNDVIGRMAPEINAGTAALQYFFAQLYDNGQTWVQALDREDGLPALHEEMFGSPWERKHQIEPLFPPNLTQPEMILPFERQTLWSFTGGPHGAWEHDGSQAAIDFAPGSSEPGCVESTRWALATAPGVVARVDTGTIVLDLDGDGNENTGWALVYLHIATAGRTYLGAVLDTGDRIGHPSCEGGVSTGTHVHIARKYNGEWIAADGPVPFVLGGWTVLAGNAPYEGFLVRGDQIVTASIYGAYASRITRTESDP